MFDAGARQLRFAGRSRDACGVDGLLATSERLDGSLTVGSDALGFDPHVVDVDVELRERLADPFARDAGMLERVPQRRSRIQRRKHLATRRLDIGLESFDLAVR